MDWPGPGLEMHALFTDNMMLQHDREIRVFGNAAPGETVNASFAGNSASSTPDQAASFMIQLPPMVFTLEGQALTVKGKGSEIVLRNVLLGDVWIGSGQILTIPAEVTQIEEIRFAFGPLNGI